MRMAVLKHTHFMVGVDFHDELAPPCVLTPSVLHLTFGFLGIPPWGLVTGKINGDVWSTNAKSVAQGSDMGFFIPHIPLPPAPANLLTPILFLFSGSKSHFGAHKHLTPKGPLAFACLKFANLNVNCAGPTRPPLPSGLVLAFWQTVYQGVTIGDLLAGALHMLVDIILQHVINRFLGTRGPGGKAVDYLSRKIGGAIAARTYFNFTKLSVFHIETIGEVLQSVMQGSRLSRILGFGFIEQVPGVLLGYLGGTPIGYSPSRALTSQAETFVDDKGQGAVASGIDTGLDKIGHAVQRLFDNPAIEQHPSTPPPGGPTVAPAPPTAPPSAPALGTPSPEPQAPPSPPSGGH